jgi:hypothetical protein
MPVELDQLLQEVDGKMKEKAQRKEDQLSVARA